MRLPPSVCFPTLALAPLALAPLALCALAPTARALPQGGQILEGFDTISTEDLSAFRRDERALWGRDSRLAATAHFSGSGGPGGAFDWRIPTGTAFVLDTTFTVITDASGSATQNVVGGFVDVRDLWIQAGATLIVRGPNPCRIVATGNVRIDGRIDARGTSNPSVVTLNTGIPQLGAAGGPGGGRGGTGSPLVGQSSPQGGAGFGAFGAPNGGGGGGETGYSAIGGPDGRRGAGGGGGRFAPDVRLVSTGCPDQARIGLDTEQGGPGAAAASGALGGPGARPQPGLPGPTPFVDGDATNDFWGVMRLGSGARIVGELPRPWAGAGGGGGGNSCNTSSFPTTPYTPAGDEIGAGGGGGGGSLWVDALGDVVFGAQGRVDVSGGTGGGGENTSGINRVGGGSGGGSGGHLILRAGRTVDLRACQSGPTGAALLALGGQGGEGMNAIGGAHVNGVPTTPALDSINLVPPFDPSCLPPVPPGVVAWVGSGGDGGPGLIQVHVQALTDILVPTTPGVTLSQLIAPPPVGAQDADAPGTWTRMEPGFGPLSSSRSQWTPLAVAPVTYLLFGGTSSDGRVLTNGSGPNARVLPAPAILNETLRAAPGLPRVDLDGRTLLVDPVSISNDLWFLAPALLVPAELEVGAAPGSQRFEVESASVSGGVLRVTVGGPGTPLAGYPPGVPVVLRPRYFRVATDGVRDWLPGSASIRIRFQGAPADATGGPDATLAGPWTADMAVLGQVPGLRFVRFEVEFDMTADGSPLTPQSPRPSLEFLRVPYL